ncbi:MAG: hypothetical protein ACK506_16290 [Pirellula sp.]
MKQRKPLKLWFIMRRSHLDGSLSRVGQPYGSLELARSWISFVRSAWRGHELRIVSYTVRFNPDGSPTDKSIRKLDRFFNLEVKEGKAVHGG